MPADLTPGLVVAHSHRLEDLTQVAVEFMQRYPLAPLEQETVLVQSNGIAQWLKINVAEHVGVAAMLQVTLPARFVWQAYRAVLGDAIPKTSPFDKDRLRWRIMRILPSAINNDDSTVYKPLRDYLSGADEPRKLYQLSDRIADLFDQYMNYRADWLDAWTHGHAVLDDHEPVPDKDGWQPKLWQALVADIGTAQFWTNRAELHRQFVRQAQALTVRPKQLPPRLLVFGISSLPQQTLEVLDALKGVMQIVLCVHNPCQHYWANIVDGKEAMQAALRHANHRHTAKPDMPDELADDDLHLYAQPLLAAWGKQGRDYIHLLDLYDETLSKQDAFNAIKFELFDEQPPQNLLQQLQNDILHLRPLSETQATWSEPSGADHSMQFHICHSAQREVEVLHDQLLEAFAQDPTLTPRDIMVMVPDVNTYAAHVEAVFGRIAPHDRRYIPYTLADQGQRHQQPLLVALEMLLTIDQSRVTQADVMSWLAVPAIQARFGFSDTDVTQIQTWFDAAGARWGLTAAHRAQFGMPADEPTNSWWFALSRMLFGYASGVPTSDEQPRWQAIEPYHEVAGLAADAAGKLAEFVLQLSQWWDTSRTERSMVDWAVHAEWLLSAFFRETTEQEQWLITQLQQTLSELLEVVDEGGFDELVPLLLLKESWLERIDEPNLNQRFLAGSVNVATLMPMRAIPFRQVYVLGMSEDAYPRRQPRMDFDLMRAHYRPGDRSRRDDDRYLFLEALLSARERFYVSWVGRSAQDNSEWPPSVLIAQLREHLWLGWGASHPQKDFLARVTTEHKLQPFAHNYMQADSLDTRFFTYAHEWLAARDTNGKVCEATLPPWQSEPDEMLYLRVRDLVNMLREPATPFFQQRLATQFFQESRETRDSEPFALLGLEGWQLQQRMLEHGLKALRDESDLSELAERRPWQQALQQQLLQSRRSGELGVAALSELMSTQLFEQCDGLLGALDEVLGSHYQVAPNQSLALELTGIDQESVWLEAQAQNLFVDQVDSLLQLQLSPSKLSDKHLFLPYIRHLLLSASMSKGDSKRVTTQAIFASRNPKKTSDIITFAPIATELAKQHLQTIVQRYLAELSQPTACVGEWALAWLGIYYKAISGELREGYSKLAAMTEEEAKATAFERILSELEATHENSLQKWPYAARINPDARAMLESEMFFEYLVQIYAPLFRLLQGQPAFMELPLSKQAAVEEAG